MMPGTRLDSVVFQLTPTRTRFDLVIFANGNEEKIASGLLDPFLVHLRTVQDQNAKGGYSIILEPKLRSAWFTKGTIGRLIRFVSTPDVLERVHTIESEIVHIEEALSSHGSNVGGDTQSVTKAKTRAARLVVDTEEGRMPSAEDSKAIVPYKTPVVSGDVVSGGQDGDSKFHLLKALDTRKHALQSEQGMAFARAMAAGFDVDHVSALLSFAECFGASRLLDACVKFIQLWNCKHENGGRWRIETAAAEAASEATCAVQLSNSPSPPSNPPLYSFVPYYHHIRPYADQHGYGMAVAEERCCSDSDDECHRRSRKNKGSSRRKVVESESSSSSESVKKNKQGTADWQEFQDLLLLRDVEEHDTAEREKIDQSLVLLQRSGMGLEEARSAAALVEETWQEERKRSEVVVDMTTTMMMMPPAADREMQVTRFDPMHDGGGEPRRTEEGGKKQKKKKKEPSVNNRKVACPLDEARARAQKMRDYKAHLQKVKKEREEEEMKRLEALKAERQKRIAARNIPPQPVRKRMPSRSASSSVPGRISASVSSSVRR